MAQRQVSSAEKVGWSDAEGKNLAVGASLPPDLLSQVAAVESPGEEGQERLFAGPTNVKVRKLLSQEVNHLLKQQQSCLLLKQDAWKGSLLGFTVCSLLKPVGTIDSSISTLLPFLPFPKPGKEAPRPAGLCVSLPSARPHSTGQSLGFSQRFLQFCSAPQPCEPLSVTAQVSYQGPAPALHGSVAERRQEGWGSSHPLWGSHGGERAITSFPAGTQTLTTVPWFLALLCMWVSWSQWPQ